MTSDEIPTQLRIPLAATLKANVEKAAAVEDQSVNDWVRNQLEQAAMVTLQRASDQQAFEEALQKEVDARAERVP